MNKKLEALTMQRRLAATRLARLAGRIDSPPAAVSKPPKSPNKNGEAVPQRYSVLSLKPQ